MKPSLHWYYFCHGFCHGDRIVSNILFFLFQGLFLRSGKGWCFLSTYSKYSFDLFVPLKFVSSQVTAEGRAILYKKGDWRVAAEVVRTCYSKHFSECWRAWRNSCLTGYIWLLICSARQSSSCPPACVQTIARTMLERAWISPAWRWSGNSHAASLPANAKSR